MLILSMASVATLSALLVYWLLIIPIAALVVSCLYD